MLTPRGASSASVRDVTGPSCAARTLVAPPTTGLGTRTSGGSTPSATGRPSTARAGSLVQGAQRANARRPNGRGSPLARPSDWRPSSRGWAVGGSAQRRRSSWRGSTTSTRIAVRGPPASAASTGTSPTSAPPGASCGRRGGSSSRVGRTRCRIRSEQEYLHPDRTPTLATARTTYSVKPHIQSSAGHGRAGSRGAVTR